MARARTTDRDAVAKRVEGKIVHASELEDTLRVLVYAYPKKGKTRFCATAPNVLILDVNEKGTASVRRDTDPFIFPVSRWDDLNDVYWYLQSGAHNFDTVALDGITSMQTLCMNRILGEEHALDASRDPDMPRGPAWQKLAQMMKTQITNYRNLPMNVIFTAQVKVRSAGSDDDGGSDLDEVVVTPACAPSVAGHLEGAVDVIGYLTTREVYVRNKRTKKKRKVTKKRLFCGDDPKYATGDRTHLFEPYLDAPDFSEMLAKYLADKEEE